MTEKANTGLVVSGYPVECVFCIPNISPPPGGKWDFTSGPDSEGITPRLPERLFLPWDLWEAVGLSLGVFQTSPLLKPQVVSLLMSLLFFLFKKVALPSAVEPNTESRFVFFPRSVIFRFIFDL